jgi:hypothetical protein
MPARYEAIRDSFVKKGKPLAAAKTSAAKIFNATRKRGEAPVTGKAEGKRRGR